MLARRHGNENKVERDGEREGSLEKHGNAWTEKSRADEVKEIIGSVVRTVCSHIILNGDLAHLTKRDREIAREIIAPDKIRTPFLTEVIRGNGNRLD